MSRCTSDESYYQRAVQMATGINNSQAKRAVTAMFETMLMRLVENRAIVLPKIGRIKLRVRKAAMRRDPNLKAVRYMPARTVAKLKMGAVLAAALRQLDDDAGRHVDLDELKRQAGQPPENAAGGG